MQKKICAATLAVFASSCAIADDDLGALSLADQAAAAPVSTRNWQLFNEDAIAWYEPRQGQPAYSARRVSFDLRYDLSFASGWRAVLADRLDMTRQQPLPATSNINALKEAYLSWQLQADNLLDFGRINTRYGVASGYNPTDYFRDSAIRSVTSANPASLRENRLGSVMLRGQTLWEGGSATAILSPHLADSSNPRGSGFDAGATNGSNRWLLSTSKMLAHGVSTEISLYGDQGSNNENKVPPQIGFNVTALPNNATVAYVEWSGGRDRRLVDSAFNLEHQRAFYARAATGLTYTSSENISLTLEYEYNAAALNRDGWETLRGQPNGAVLRYLGYTNARQDLPMRHAGYLYVSWQDALIRRLDLTSLIRLDADEHSHMAWVEARYHWDHVDLAMQWQVNCGKPISTFGAIPTRSAVQGLVRYFF